MTALDIPIWLAAAVLFVVGAVSSSINVVAGGGSFLSLPILIFLGLPPTVANGTNRIAILVQNIGAVWTFDRHGLISWELVPRAALPAIAGAGLGTWAAIEIGDDSFRRILAVLMVTISLASLWFPARRLAESPRSDAGLPPQPRRVVLAAAFFAAGFYGGFVQAGVGYLLLAATSLAGLDLVRGNALKVLLVLLFTPLSLGLFAASGQVDWAMGLALAAGSLVGGLAGARLTIRRGDRWVRRVVTATAIAFAILIWLGD